MRISIVRHVERNEVKSKHPDCNAEFKRTTLGSFDFAQDDVGRMDSSTFFCMNIEERQSNCFRLSIDRDGKEVGRAHLFLITNDLHDTPYGLLEDVFVDETYRGAGIGTELVSAVVAKAREVGCYKLLATSRMSRSEVHLLYEKLGFEKWGYEFRMNLI